MKVKRRQVSLAFRLWVLATAFVLPYLGHYELAGWCAFGGALGLWWKSLPEDAPEPVQPLPFQNEYLKSRNGK